jgi:lipopolysaccharide transport system permease protein
VSNLLQRRNSLRAAINDLREGITSYHIWGTLGWQDIRQRYRRSVIGPFWLTISTAIMVASMGFLYARIMNQGVAQYLPYLAVGLIVWGTISTIVNEACVVFISNEHLIKQVRLPLTVHVCRLVWRNAVIFGHNALILAAVLFLFASTSIPAILVAILGAGMLFLNGIWIGLVIGLVCARFRDVPPIVVNVMQIVFFLTPILWQSSVLGNKLWVAHVNPFHHQIEIIRAPLLGEGLPWMSLVAVAITLAIGMLVAVAMLARYRHRLAYWL